MFSFIRTRRGVSNCAGANRFQRSVKLNFDPLEARETPATTTMATVMPMAAATYGSMTPVQASVTPNPGANNGTLSFYDNGSQISGANAVALDANGMGTFQFSNLSAGDHMITVVYNGGNGFDASGTSTPTMATINPAPLTISANNQTKAPNTDFAFTGNEFTSTGLQNGDTIGSVTFATPNGGTAASDPSGSYPIQVSSATGGTFNPSNYTITYVPGTLSFGDTSGSTATTATVSPTTSSVYGGPTTISATVAPNPGAGNGTVSFFDNGVPIQSGSAVAIGNNGLASFQVSNLSAGNHSITAMYSGGNGFAASPVATSVNQTVAPAPLTVGGITATDRPYDATNTAALNVGSAYLIGVQGSDQVNLNVVGSSGTFADPHAGSAKPVTVSGLSLTGANASNYTLMPTTTTATISPQALNVTGISANNKSFDNSTSATLNTSQAALQGVISPDVVNLNTANATGTFASPNAGNGVNVAVNGLMIDNPDYTLNPFTTTANITSGSTPSQQLANVTMNGGTGPFAGAQGSQVVNTQLDFGQPVQLDQGAVTLALHTNNVNYGGNAVPSGMGAIPDLTLTPNADMSVWTVTFSGANAQTGTNGFASLKDGVYDLNINGAMVHPTSNPSSSLGGTSTTTFGSLFGKSTGPTSTPNGTGTDYSMVLNSADNLAFRKAFNNDANYQAYFDFDGNGVINSGDNLAFRQRFNKALTWTTSNAPATVV